jgi:beta-galactosidase
VNGISAGRNAAGAASQNKVSFDVTYQPGFIEAVGYTGGRETGRTRLVTASEPAVLSVTADRAVIRAGGGDIGYVTIEVQDRDGVMVKHGEPFIGMEVTGAGELIAIGSGNPLSDEMYVGNQHKAYHGRLLAIVRSAAQAGNITLTAHTEGLPAANIELQAR